MGKVTGFLEIDRQDRKYQPAGDRVRHFREFVIPLDDSQLRQQGARCMDCGIPFCHTGCPVNNIIPDWNDLVYHDRWREALEVLHSTNNFPEFTGRICPRRAKSRARSTSTTCRSPSRPSNARSSTAAGRKAGSRPTSPRKRRASGSRSWARVPPAWRARSSSPAPAIRSRCLRNTRRSAGCCATASPTSRWKSTISTAASSRWRRKASRCGPVSTSASMFPPRS